MVYLNLNMNLNYHKKRTNSMSNTLLVGYLPPPVEGLTTAFEMLVNGFKENKIPYRLINLSSRDSSRPVGTFTFRRALEIIQIMLSYLWNLTKSKNVYITIAVSQVGFISNCVMIWLAKILSRRIVLHVHSGGYKDFYDRQTSLMKYAIRVTLNRANKIILLDDVFRSHFDFISNPEEHISIVPNGLPKDSNQLIEKRTIHNKGQEGIQLLYLSNMIESKGYLDVLEACRILHNERKIRFFCSFCGLFYPSIVDNKPYSSKQIEEQFNKKIRDYGLQSVVNYYGPIYGSDKEAMLQKSDVFILPTYYSLEGQPISIIEAMAYGMPIIATRYRGIPTQVKDGQNGFLIEPQSPAEIANKVEWLVFNPEIYQQMRRNSWTFFEEKFSRSAYLKQILLIILGEIEPLSN